MLYTKQNFFYTYECNFDGNVVFRVLFNIFESVIYRGVLFDIAGSIVLTVVTTLLLLLVLSMRSPAIF